MNVVHNPGILEKKLFDKYDVGISYKDSTPSFLRIVDNKLMAVALKIIQTSSLILACSLVVGSVVLLGVTFIPTGVVASLLGVGLICYVVRSHFQKYYNKESLQKYQQEATQLIKVDTYLDGIADVSDSVKPKFLRPLTHLIEKHHNLFTIIKYRILSPEDFKKAFDLDIKYLQPVEQVLFYSKVKIAVASHRDYAGIISNPADWSKTLKDYITKQQDLFKPDNLIDYDAINEASLRLIDFFTIASLLDNKVIDPNTRMLIKNCKNKVDQGRKVYNVAKGVAGSRISFLEKKIAQLEQEKDEKYQMHESHKVVSQELKQFFKHIQDVQKDQEHKINALNERRTVNCRAIDARRVLGPDGVLGYSQEDAKLYQEYQRRYEIQKSDIEKKNKECFNDCVGMSMQADFLMARQQLQVYRNLVEAEYQPGIQRFSDELVDLKNDIDKEVMKTFKTVLIQQFNALQGAILR
ncbi:MAG: hypothetical protein WCG10_05890 [Chlamydiota bacterium]